MNIAKLKTRSLKPITISFIFANLFDVVSTVLGLMAGAVEMNVIVVSYGWPAGIMVKILGMVITILFLEIFETWWFSWAISIIPWLAVVWNIGVLISIVLF